MQLKNKLLQATCGMTPEKRSACQSMTWTCCKVVLEKSPLASWVSVETVHLVNFHSCAGLAKHCHQEPWGFLYLYTLFLSPPHSELSPLKMYALWAYLCCCLVCFFLSFIMTKAFIWMLQIQAGRVSSSVKIFCLGLVGCYRV